MRILIACLWLAGFSCLAQAADGRVAVIFERESGDEYFYSLQGGKDSGCMVAQGDVLIFSGPGIIKGLVAPFRGAAKKECGAWRVSKKSAPGRIVFEASSEAALRQPCDGFILTGRMGSLRNDEGKLGMVSYECAGKGCALQGELPGPVASPEVSVAAHADKQRK